MIRQKFLLVQLIFFVIYMDVRRQSFFAEEFRSRCRHFVNGTELIVVDILWLLHIPLEGQMGLLVCDWVMQSPSQFVRENGLTFACSKLFIFRRGLHDILATTFPAKVKIPSSERNTALFQLLPQLAIGVCFRYEG